MNNACFLAHAPPARGRLAHEAVGLGPWFHNLHLPDGTETAPDHPLGDFPSLVWNQFKGHLPDDLWGWSVLDLGCNAGFHSFELARRGARVTAVDADPHFLRQAKWAVQHLGFAASIDFRLAQIYEIAHWPETFDLVLFMGVFYHLRYPLLGLDLAAEKARRLLIFQSLSLPGEEIAGTPENQTFDDRAAMNAPGWPRLAFIEHALAGDSTNWFVPNQAAVQALLRSTGFDFERLASELYLCRPSARHTATRASLLAELDAATARDSFGP